MRKFSCILDTTRSIRGKSLTFATFKLAFLIVALGSSTPSAIANPMPGDGLNHDVKHYLKGTMGEPLAMDDYILSRNRCLRLQTEVRYSDYGDDHNSIDSSHNDAPVRNRLSLYLATDYGVSRTLDIGLRVPFVRIEGGFGIHSRSNSGLGDVLLRMRIGLHQRATSSTKVALGLGIKLPTGGEGSSGDYVNGTGTLDIVAALYGATDLKSTGFRWYVGYALRTDPNVFDRTHSDVGDVVSFDLMVTQRISRGLIACVGGEGHIKGPSGGFGDQMTSLSPSIGLVLPSVGTNTQLELGVSHEVYADNALSGLSFFARFIWNASVR